MNRAVTRGGGGLFNFNREIRGGDYSISNSKRKTGEGGYFTLNRETIGGGAIGFK